MLKKYIVALLLLCAWPAQAYGIDFSGRLRYRLEFFKNYNKYEKPRSVEDSEEIVHFTRLDLKASQLFNGGDELFAEVRGSLAGGSSNVENVFKPDDTVLLHQGYVKLHDALGKNLTITIGRQELRFGRERLVGADDWDNIGRSFDGILLTGRKNAWTVDAFATRVTDPATSFSDGTFAGLNIKHEDAFRTIREIYVYHRSIPNLDPARSINFKLTNVGVRGEGKISDRVFYEFMGNYQFGHHTQYEPAFAAGTQVRHKARNYMAHVDYFLGDHVFSNAGVEYSSSTGDRGSASVHETFMPLFPSVHPHYGAMDWFAPMNADILSVYTFYNITLDATGLIELHSFKLNSGNSSWYLGSLLPAWWGVPNVNWPGAGTAPRNAGTELDLSWRIRASRSLAYHFGFSVFYPGDLFKTAQWWNTGEKAQWGYFQVQKDF